MKPLTFLFLLLFHNTLLAHQFLPENDLHLEDQHFLSNLTEDDFDWVMGEISYLYAPIVAKMGARLVIDGDWYDSTVNAYAYQNGNTWVVQMFGGMARRPEVNIQAFALIVCHELGHHLAGFPAYSGSWASSEGQSDYFSTMVCGRKFFSTIRDDVEYLNATAIRICKEAYDGSKRRTCYHVLKGASGLSSLLSNMSGERSSFDTPSTSRVSRTNTSHPSAQCRLDTMVSGVLCQKEWVDMVIPTRANQADYNCTIGDGARPRCWYAP